MSSSPSALSSSDDADASSDVSGCGVVGLLCRFRRGILFSRLFRGAVGSSLQSYGVVVCLSSMANDRVVGCCGGVVTGVCGSSEYVSFRLVDADGYGFESVRLLKIEFANSPHIGFPYADFRNFLSVVLSSCIFGSMYISSACRLYFRANWY